MQQVHVFGAFNDSQVKYECSVCYLYGFLGFKTFKEFDSKRSEMAAILFYGKKCHNILAFSCHSD